MTAIPENRGRGDVVHGGGRRRDMRRCHFIDAAKRESLGRRAERRSLAYGVKKRFLGIGWNRPAELTVVVCVVRAVIDGRFLMMGSTESAGADPVPYPAITAPFSVQFARQKELFRLSRIWKTLPFGLA